MLSFADRGTRLLAVIVLAVLVPAVPAAAEGSALAQLAPDTTIAADEQPDWVPDLPEIGLEIESEGSGEGLSQSVTVLVMLTLVSLVPGLVVVMTSFTRFIVVFGITRNALGLHTIPPNIVLVGLSLIMTFFVMGTVLGEVNEQGIQPLLSGEVEFEQAIADGFEPLQSFMLAQTNEDDLRLFVDLSNQPRPEAAVEIPASTLIPAFVISELKAAFTIGFVVFLPFLVIDLVVSAVLMSLGMVMLPPVFISLPIKLLVFVLVDGWVLLIGSLVSSVSAVGG